MIWGEALSITSRAVLQLTSAAQGAHMQGALVRRTVVTVASATLRKDYVYHEKVNGTKSFCQM